MPEPRPPRFMGGVIVTPRPPVSARLILGLVVIALGVLFTLDNLGLVAAGEILRWWPVVPLGYGLMRLTGTCCRRHVTAGILFTVLGAWLLLHELGLIALSSAVLWPVLLILVGASMVARASARARATAPVPDAGGSLNAFAFWSGSEQRVTSPEFHGGDVTAIMGGHDIDLRGAKMANGAAEIELLVLMGGVDLLVPEDWRVTNRALTLMGGFQDQTVHPAAEPKGHLILRGLVLMGGVEVKN